MAKAEVVKVAAYEPHLVEVDVRLLNPWDEPVYIGVCDAPSRLDGVTTYLEQLVDGKWKKVGAPKGVVLGDLPPESVELKPGTVTELPYSFNRAFVGLRPQTKLRVVVLARRKGGTQWRSPRFITNAFTLSAEN